VSEPSRRRPRQRSAGALERAPGRRGPARARVVEDEGLERANRKSEILAIAASLFAEQGFEATTIRQVGDVAGILSGSLYHHFAEKNQILHELLQPFGETVVAQYQFLAQRPGPPDEVLAHLIRFAIEQIAAAPHLHKIINNEDRFFRRTPEFSYAWMYSQDMARIFYGVLQEGVRSGTFRVDLKIDLITVLIIKLINTTPDWFQLGGRYSIDLVVRAQLDLILNGVMRPGLVGQADPDVVWSQLLPEVNSFVEGSQPGQGRRAELLAAAAGVIAEHGFEAASVRQMSEAASILSCSFYHHFADKSEVLHELIRPFGASLVATYQNIVRRPGAPDEALCRIVAFAIEALTRAPHLHAIINKEDRFFRRTPQFSYAWTYGQDVARIFYGVLQEGLRAEAFRDSLRIDIVTVLIVKLISATIDWFASTGRYASNEVIGTELDLVLHGLRRV
jgi:AcrR family transcriptional regulator